MSVQAQSGLCIQLYTVSETSVVVQPYQVPYSFSAAECCSITYYCCHRRPMAWDTHQTDRCCQHWPASPSTHYGGRQTID